MTDKDLVKHFFCLELPAECQDYISRAAQILPRHHGHCLGAPFKRTSYHLTLGVVEVSSQKVPLLESLLEKLQEFLDSLNTHSLIFNEIGWYDAGAVYLKLDETTGPGYILLMRKMIMNYCLENGIQYLESDNFHISLFKTNNFPEGVHISTDTYVLSLGRYRIGHRASIDTVALRVVKADSQHAVAIGLAARTVRTSTQLRG